MIFKKERDGESVTGISWMILLCVFLMKNSRNRQKDIAYLSKTEYQKVNIV